MNALSIYPSSVSAIKSYRNKKEKKRNRKEEKKKRNARKLGEEDGEEQ